MDRAHEITHLQKEEIPSWLGNKKLNGNLVDHSLDNQLFAIGAQKGLKVSGNDGKPRPVLQLSGTARQKHQQLPRGTLSGWTGKKGKPSSQLHTEINSQKLFVCHPAAINFCSKHTIFFVCWHAYSQVNTRHRTQMELGLEIKFPLWGRVFSLHLLCVLSAFLNLFVCKDSKSTSSQAQEA